VSAELAIRRTESSDVDAPPFARSGGLSRSEIETILDTADSLVEVSQRRRKKLSTLKGKVVVNLFFEPSTRTRTSFGLAAKRLSADTIDFSPGARA